jgi:hypothetical protein
MSVEKLFKGRIALSRALHGLFVPAKLPINGIDYGTKDADALNER